MDVLAEFAGYPEKFLPINFNQIQNRRETTATQEIYFQNLSGDSKLTKDEKIWLCENIDKNIFSLPNISRRYELPRTTIYKWLNIYRDPSKDFFDNHGRRFAINLETGDELKELILEKKLENKGELPTTQVVEDLMNNARMRTNILDRKRKAEDQLKLHPDTIKRTFARLEINETIPDTITDARLKVICHQK